MPPVNRREALAALSAMLVAGCSSQPSAPEQAQAPIVPNDMHDVHSYGQPDKVRVRTLALDLAASFEKRTLAGTAVLGIDAATGTDPLIVDTRDLDIEAIETSPDNGAYTGTEWKVGDRDAILGSPLTINLPANTRYVRVRYACRPTATGLQWLEPRQTAGKRKPFLFSQNQSIHARSWIPIQDSPGVRISYTAKITGPKDLTILMSAEHKNAAAEGGQKGTAEFEMTNPVPAYLIALAIGDLEFQSTGPRTGVYAEPPLLAKAAAEFSDMEKLVTAVEQMYGPYRWGRYDLLVLPPSFPFGGMENPRLTFATPTVIAGDKSMVGLVSHELAHSWSGNLVTNATWSDFWLNEGFTTYIENRIQEAVYGEQQAEMERALEMRGLEQELAEMKPADQVLHADLAGRDPDEGVTGVPYAKGASFLRRLEQVFGRPAFDAYLRSYFDNFAFQSINTASMLSYMQKELFAKHPEEAKQVDLKAWITEPGLPADTIHPVSQRLTSIANQAKAFAEGKVGALTISTKTWSTQEWLEFLQNLPNATALQMKELDDTFLVTKTGNSEVLDEWLQMAIRANYTPAYPRLESFLMEVGRQKFLRPLYTELMKTPVGQKQARAIYAKARPGYHPIAQGSMDKIVLAEK